MKKAVSTSQNSLLRAEEAVRNDHRKLEQLAAQLRAAKGLPALLSAAEQLHKALILHFAHEEHPGGLYDSLKYCVAQHSKELAQLVEEHHDITAGAWQLCQGARDPQARLQALRREAAQLVGKLQRHEAREHEMAQQALSVALGRDSLVRVEEAVRNDHRKLEQLAALLRAAPDQSALLSTAVRLHQALISHFAHEEQPAGLYDSLKYCVPQHSKELAQLVEEHHDITAAAWQLCQRAHDSKARLQTLRKEAAQLSRTIQRHEKREAGIARQASVSV